MSNSNGASMIVLLQSTIAGLRKDLAGQVRATEELKTRPIGYLAIGPYTWGRGSTPLEAVKNLCGSGGALKTDRFYLQAYIGDDKPSVDGGGMVSRKTGTQVVTLGYFKTIGAYLRNATPEKAGAK